MQKPLKVIAFFVWVGFLAAFYVLYLESRIQLQIQSKTESRPLDSEKLWSLVQDWRLSQNLAPFTKRQDLCDTAKKRLPEIKDDFSHDGFYKHNWFLMKNHGGVYTWTGENLAKGYSSEELALKAWLNSPTHLENLVSPYKYSCIETDGWSAVQLFGNF